MYSHLTKGFTVGQTLTRRLFRNITGIIGGLIDIFLFAPFATPHYSSYWEKTGRTYLDGTEVSGFGRLVTGWVGDIVGCCVGAIVGTLIGFVCYIPDMLLQGLCFINDKINEKLSEFADVVGSHEFCNVFSTKNPARNYIEKAWNISVGTLGIAIATPLYVAARVVEFFLPFLGNNLSNAAWKVGGHIGGAIGTVASLAIYPVKYACTKMVSFYRGFRDTVRSIIAFIYSRTKQEPKKEKDEEKDKGKSCIPPDAIHSLRFREEVEGYNNSTTARILYGSKQEAKTPLLSDDKEVKRAPLSADPLICPLTGKRMTDPVITPEGNTYDRAAILEALKTTRNRDPFTKKPLTEKQLAENKAVKTLLTTSSLKLN